VRKQHEDDFVAYVTGRLPVLRRVAAQLAGDAHRGDDLVQQAITRLYTRWRRVSQTEHLDAYVYKILLRVFLDERRLRWSTVRLGASAADLAHRVDVERAAAGVEDHAAGVGDRMLLRAALALLPPKQRAAVVLRFLADRSINEVAEILNAAAYTSGVLTVYDVDGFALEVFTTGDFDAAVALYRTVYVHPGAKESEGLWHYATVS
jgi:RNA polymerase sigma factor (sigma-70 family)